MATLDAPSDKRRRRLGLIVGAVVVLAAVVALIVALTTGRSSSSGDGRPVVIMTPAPGSSHYHDGQQIEVSVGPNKLYIPYSRVILIQCSDPDGKVANLPKSNIGCDGNTVPGYSTLVNKDGSFSNKLTLYSLPNTLLGEPADLAPACNLTHACVLLVAEDQTNFAAPKLFSAPFTIVPSHIPKARP
jgi:hypothetical protein